MMTRSTRGKHWVQVSLSKDGVRLRIGVPGDTGRLTLVLPREFPGVVRLEESRPGTVSSNVLSTYSVRRDDRFMIVATLSPGLPAWQGNVYHLFEILPTARVRFLGHRVSLAKLKLLMRDS